MIFNFLENIITKESAVELNQQLLTNTLLATRQSYFQQYWFFYALFSAQILLWVILKIQSKWLRWGITGIIFAGTVYLHNSIDLVLPLCLEEGMLMLPFIEVGYDLKAVTSLEIKKNSMIVISVFLGSALVVLNIVNSTFVAVYNSEIGNPAMFIIKASIGCCCVLSLGKILENSKILERIDRNSAVIYGLHFLFFDITVVLENVTMKYLSITKISGTMILVSMAFVVVEIITNGNEKLKQRWRLKTSG